MTKFVQEAQEIDRTWLKVTIFMTIIPLKSERNANITRAELWDIRWISDNLCHICLHGTDAKIVLYFRLFALRSTGNFTRISFRLPAISVKIEISFHSISVPQLAQAHCSLCLLPLSPITPVGVVLRRHAQNERWYRCSHSKSPAHQQAQSGRTALEKCVSH